MVGYCHWSKRLRIRQYDPPKSLPYSQLIGVILRNYDKLGSPQDLTDMIGPSCLTDITFTPEMDSTGGVQLYAGGEQRIYQFKESNTRGGTIDVFFNHGHLESLNARLIFTGIWGKPGAAVYSSLGFSRLINSFVGRGNIQYDAVAGRFFCYYDELVVSYNHQMELNLPSISTVVSKRKGCSSCLVAADRHQQLVCAQC